MLMRRLSSARRRRPADRNAVVRTLAAKARDVKEVTIELAQGPPVRLTFNKLAKLADGSCVASLGNTSVLATAVCKDKPTSANHNGAASSSSFVPLTVDYRQKASAVGRIPTNFLRREMGPSEREILVSRAIDRSVRPLFPRGFSADTQLVCNLLSAGGDYDPDVAALLAASASLAASDVPWRGPVGAVKVSCLDRTRLLVNASRKEMKNSKSDLSMIVAGDVAGNVVMIEAEANNLDKTVFLEGLQYGVESCREIARQISAATGGAEKRPLPPSVEIPSEIVRDLALLCEQKLLNIFSEDGHDKQSRDSAMFAVRDEAVKVLKESYPNVESSVLNDCFGRLTRKLAADLALDHQRRVDGRGFNQLRPISCEAGLHEPLHGSALFQRGQTQVLCTLALDSIEQSLKSDPSSILMGGVREKNFFLHYEFPPYATNEIGRTGGVGRRELGHGALAEKALRPLIPDEYPFAMKLNSEVLESNGSSSMATVCGGTLALLDAGVPLKENVAGVAVGLMSRTDSHGELKERQVILDILGFEDYLGDMDFKVAGTRSGITALQADIKLPGVPYSVMEEATEVGFQGISNILDIMDECLASPRTDKVNLPVTDTIIVPPHQRSKVIGPGGINVQKITAETGARLSQQDDGSFFIFAPNPDALIEAKEMIDEYLVEDLSVPEYEFGAILTVKVLEVKERFIVVEMHKNIAPVTIHINQLSPMKVVSTESLGIEVGSEMQVKYFGRDPQTGAVRLSRKALTVAAAGAVKMLRKNARSFSTTAEALMAEEMSYYDLDRLLNSVMQSQSELAKARERLRLRTLELEEAEKKYVFLKATRKTNPHLAEPYLNQALQRYRSIALGKKAVEEIVDMLEIEVRDGKARFDRAFRQASPKNKSANKRTFTDFNDIDTSVKIMKPVKSDKKPIIAKKKVKSRHKDSKKPL